MVSYLRVVAVAVAFLGVVLSGAPAQAAEPAWARAFLTHCVGNLRDFKPAVEQAISEGYVDTGAPAPSRYSHFRLLRATEGGSKLAVGEVIGQSSGRANFIRHCLVEGVDVGTSGADAIKTWVGLAPDKMEPGYVDYVFSMEKGALKNLSGASQDTIREVFFNGGYWLLSIELEGGLTSVTLSYTGPVR